MKNEEEEKGKLTNKFAGYLSSKSENFGRLVVIDERRKLDAVWV